MELTVEELVGVLRELRQAYTRWWKTPEDELRWAACESLQRKAVEALRTHALGDLVDPAIAAAIESGHATPALATPNLREAGREILDPEQRLGQTLGYDDREFRNLVKTATKALRVAQREGRTLDAPQTAAALADHLMLIHQRVRATFKESVVDPRRTKKAHRKEAQEYLGRNLYVVGGIVTNAAAQENFAFSYALALGLHAAHPTARKRVKIPIWQRLAA
jgi:hypothetical protein